ncbi:MAG TPA: hypothetical protein VGF99_14375, partial [Myxococcota bacterium]
AECSARYRGTGGHPGLWQHEPVYVPGEQLDRLADVVEVYACTGRDRWEFERAEERLGFSFARATIAEQVRKPDARALLRLIDDGEIPEVVVLVGDTMADRLTVKHARKKRPDLRFAFVDVDASAGAAAFVAAVLEEGLTSSLARFAEPA